MHVLITGDEEGSIKSSVIQDVKKVSEMTKQISQAINMKRRSHTIETKKLSSRAILQWIEKAPIKDDDVFIFYFSGHGFLSKKKSQWPSLYFSKADEFFDLTAIIEAIAKKGPRLSISLCDACNNPVHAMKAKSIPKTPSPSSSFNTREKKQLKQLFLRTKGRVIACGAVPGTVAWGTANGGLFTGTFFLQLKQETKKSHPSWKHLLSTTKKLCSHVQKPLIEIKTSSHN